MKIICISGQGGVGKDTFVNFCGSEETGIYNVSMIDPVKKIATIVGWTGSKDLRDRRFLSDLKDLLSDYDDYPFKNVLNSIDQIIRNHEWYKWSTSFSHELIIFVHSRELEDLQRWRFQYGARSLLIRREEVEGNYGNHSDDQVFDIEYDYEIKNNGDLNHLRKEADSFIKKIREEKWSSNIWK